MNRLLAFVKQTAQVLPQTPLLARSYLGAGQVDAALREKVMLAVSAANGCRYCVSIHGALADLEGVGQNEREALGQVCHLPVSPHLDERSRRAVAHGLKALGLGGGEAHPAGFSREELGEIVAFARAMQLANVSGLALDAFLDRLKGTPREDWSLADELGILVLLWPVAAPALGLYGLSRWYWRLGGEG